MSKKMVTLCFIVFVSLVVSFIITAIIVQKNKVVPCHLFSEEQCRNDNKCKVIMGPRDCGSDPSIICPQDFVFQGCGYIGN